MLVAWLRQFIYYWIKIGPKHKSCFINYPGHCFIQNDMNAVSAKGEKKSCHKRYTVIANGAHLAWAHYCCSSCFLSSIITDSGLFGWNVPSLSTHTKLSLSLLKQLLQHSASSTRRKQTVRSVRKLTWSSRLDGGIDRPRLDQINARLIMWLFSQRSSKIDVIKRQIGDWANKEINSY